MNEFPTPGVAELADALDSKFRNQRFHLINSHQTPLAFFIGKSSISRVFHSASRDGQRIAESRTKSRTQPVLDERTPCDALRERVLAIRHASKSGTMPAAVVQETPPPSDNQ